MQAASQVSRRTHLRGPPCLAKPALILPFIEYFRDIMFASGPAGAPETPTRRCGPIGSVKIKQWEWAIPGMGRPRLWSGRPEDRRHRRSSGPLALLTRWPRRGGAPDDTSRCGGARPQAGEGPAALRIPVAAPRLGCGDAGGALSRRRGWCLLGGAWYPDHRSGARYTGHAAPSPRPRVRRVIARLRLGRGASTHRCTKRVRRPAASPISLRLGHKGARYLDHRSGARYPGQPPSVTKRRASRATSGLSPRCWAWTIQFTCRV